jgi:hypothetical protein
MEIWEPKTPGTLWATPGLLRDSFISYLFLLLLRLVNDIWDLYSIAFLSGSKHVHSAGHRNLNSNVLPLPGRLRWSSG